MELSAIFTKAADAIRDRGHSRYLLEGDDGSVCLKGAISLVVSGDPLKWSPQTDEAIDALRPLVGDQSPVAWNNADGRTKTQVIRLLRKAARSLTSAQQRHE